MTIVLNFMGSNIFLPNSMLKYCLFFYFDVRAYHWLSTKTELPLVNPTYIHHCHYDNHSTVNGVSMELLKYKHKTGNIYCTWNRTNVISNFALYSSFCLFIRQWYKLTCRFLNSTQIHWEISCLKVGFHQAVVSRPLTHISFLITKSPFMIPPALRHCIVRVHKTHNANTNPFKRQALPFANFRPSWSHSAPASLPKLSRSQQIPSIALIVFSVTPHQKILYLPSCK